MQHLSKSSKLIAYQPIKDCTEGWTEISHIKLPESVVLSEFKLNLVQKIDDDDLNLLYEMYGTLYPNLEFTLSDLATMTLRFNKLDLGCEKFITGNTNQSKLCMILANWCDSNGLVDAETSNVRLGLIKYFFRHRLQISGQIKTHILCAMQWFSDFQDSMPTGYISPVQVFKKKSVKPGPAVFMPVQRIMHKCAYSFKEVNGYKDCIVVSPISFEIYH